MTDVKHILILGDTQSGKTYFANHVHQVWPHVSIFINTNDQDVYGYPIQHPNQLVPALGKSRHIVYVPPEDANLKERNLIIKAMQRELFRIGKGWHTQWCQFIVDEAQEYTTGAERKDIPDPVKTMSTRGLGAYGIRLVCITQYPTGINPTTRTNLKDRIVFDPGDEGDNFIVNKGWDHWEQARDHIAKPYHYAHYQGKRLLALAEPV